MPLPQTTIQPRYDDSGVNVGDLVLRALAAKQASLERKFELFNPTSDNFPLLFKVSGVRDSGHYTLRWSPKTDFEKSKGYSKHTGYRLILVKRFRKVSKVLTTFELLDKLNIEPTLHATTRELLGLFVAHRLEIKKFLKQGHRIVALGHDIFHPHGAALLSLRKGRLCLIDIPFTGQATWLPSDMFIVRVKDPS